MRNFHAQLDAILASLRIVHINGGVLLTVIIGNKMKEVIVKCPIAFIVGDYERNYQLCGKYKSHSVKTARISRFCETSPQDADNPDVCCIKNHQKENV